MIVNTNIIIVNLAKIIPGNSQVKLMRIKEAKLWANNISIKNNIKRKLMIISDSERK